MGTRAFADGSLPAGISCALCDRPDPILYLSTDGFHRIGFEVSAEWLQTLKAQAAEDSRNGVECFSTNDCIVSTFLTCANPDCGMSQCNYPRSDRRLQRHGRWQLRGPNYVHARGLHV